VRKVEKKNKENRRGEESYHIVKHRSKATIKAIIIDSLLFFFWIPSIKRVKLGTDAAGKKMNKKEKKGKREEKRKERGKVNGR
jgi:hypothetical protein